jgi:hypothetical protein
VTGVQTCALPIYERFIVQDPLNLLVGGSNDQAVGAFDACHNQSVQLSTSSWDTADPSIATAVANPDGKTGHVTGKAAGSTTDRAYVRNFAPDSRGYCRWWTVPTDGTVNVAPTITGISPAMGLVGTSVSVTLNGSGFNGSNLSIQVPGITPLVNSSSATQIQATFVIDSNAAGGNHAVTVTASGQTSSSANFYVQIPSKLSISNYGSLNIITNGNVVDYFGVIRRTNQCGVDDVVALPDVVVAAVKDQQGTTIIGVDFTLTESFSNYTTTLSPNPGTPPAESSIQNTSLQPLADIQWIGYTAPTCLASNAHEAFDQSFKVKVSATTYPLSTVYHVERGKYSGTSKVDVTVKIP